MVFKKGPYASVRFVSWINFHLVATICSQTWAWYRAAQPKSTTYPAASRQEKFHTDSGSNGALNSVGSAAVQWPQDRALCSRASCIRNQQHPVTRQSPVRVGIPTYRFELVVALPTWCPSNWSGTHTLRGIGWSQREETNDGIRCRRAAGSRRLLGFHHCFIAGFASQPG